MKAQEIIRQIRNLEVYSPEEFAEYSSYFRQKDGFSAYANTSSRGANEIKKRIESKTGSSSAETDYSLCERILKFNQIASVRKNSTVGVVSGCFDLLHLGHIRGMAYAKQFLGQYNNPILISLVLSDENIRAKKGEARPILNINERLDMLCSMELVDYIIPLEQPNCLAVLEKLKPEYFFKTNSDRTQEIVRKEMELVESYGGKVDIFPKIHAGELKSTTKIIESVLERIMREW